MRVLIADDEAPARAKLRRLLSQEADVDIAAEASTGREAVAAIKRVAPDLVFLDIQMPGLDGFGVLDAIAADAAPPQIVFVTAFDMHALEAFEVGAVDYLLKPYPPERFAVVLARARERLAARGGRASAAQPVRSYLKRLLVQRDDRAVFLQVEQIDRVEADRNYVELFAGPARYRVRATIAAVAERLDPAQFVRLNRSTLVRVDLITSMHEWSHGDYQVVLRDGSRMIWSRRYRAAAEQEFGLG
jgi:two-component system LytT family response regulator